MPAVTSVHNERRWIGGSLTSDEVGRGHTPSPDPGGGPGQPLRGQWEGRPKYMPVSWKTTAPQRHLSLNYNLHSQIPACLWRPCLRICPLLVRKNSTAAPFNETDVNVVIWGTAARCQVTAQDHTQDKLAREQRTVSENREEDAARMSAGSLHEIAHTVEHVFNVSRLLLRSSVLLFSDKSRDLSQLPHFPLFRSVFCCCL